MKHIGIDYGTKRIGVATSDDGGSMAFPHSVVPAGKTAIAAIAAIIAKERVGAIVVGESHDLSGRPNPIMEEVRRFATELEAATGITPEYMTEVYTSKEAMHIQATKA
jgi:putative Holliday junction resolvase